MKTIIAFVAAVSFSVAAQAGEVWAVAGNDVEGFIGLHDGRFKPCPDDVPHRAVAVRGEETKEGCYNIAEGAAIKIRWTQTGKVVRMPMTVFVPTEYGRRFVLGAR